MKKWIISRGYNAESAPKSYIESRTLPEIFSEYTETEYQLDDTIAIYDDESEAMTAFGKMKSDILICGNEIRYNIIELGVETGNFDDNEWCADFYEKIAVAPI
mgnify:CR=1 FL=1